MCRETQGAQRRPLWMPACQPHQHTVFICLRLFVCGLPQTTRDETSWTPTARRAKVYMPTDESREGRGKLLSSFTRPSAFPGEPPVDYGG
jgi:hypothetical protein